jgi:hypothetical protein
MDLRRSWWSLSKERRNGLVGFQVLTAVSTKMAVFWVVAPCCLHHQGDEWDDGGSKDLWNVGKLLPDYTALQPKRQPSSRNGFFLSSPCNMSTPYVVLQGRLSHWGNATAIRTRKKSTTLNSWRVVIASWSRWWEKYHYELKVRPVGDYKVIFSWSNRSRVASVRERPNNKSMEPSPWKADNCSAGYEVSLPWSREPDTGYYPEPVESSPHPHVILL